MPCSVVPHRAHVVASHSGGRSAYRPQCPSSDATPAAAERPRLACQQVAQRAYPCGTPRPTDRDVHRAAAPRGSRTPTPCLPTGGATGLSLRHPSAYRPRCPSSGGTPRQPNARGGFRPANAAHPLPHSSPQAAHKRLINSYKFLLSPAQSLAAAPIGPPLARSAIAHSGHRGGSLLIYFPLHGDEAIGLFFVVLSWSYLAALPAPLQALSAVTLPRPPLGGRFPTTSAAQSPESRLCGGCPHPFTPFIHPIARAPRL